MADIKIYRPDGSDTITVDDTDTGLVKEKTYTSAATKTFGFNGDIAWVLNTDNNRYILLSNVNRINNLEGNLTQTVSGVEEYFLSILGSDITTAGDVTAPKITSITIEDEAQTAVVMVFDEIVTGTNLGFTIAGTTSATFSSISGSGTNTITGTLAAKAVSGETITLSYVEATGDIADASANTNALESITTQAVTNNAVAPTMTSATVEDTAPKDIVMVFNEAVSGTNLGFAIQGTTSSTFSSIAGSGTTTITGTLAANVAETETVLVDYVEVTGDLVDTDDGNPLVDIVGQSVTNNTVAPTLISASVTDALPTKIVMVFSEAMTGTNLGFTIAGTTSVGFASIAGSGTDTITGTLAANVQEGETVTLSYSESTGDLVDGDTNALIDITSRAVTSTVDAPNLVSATIENGAQTALVMVFDQNVTGTNLGFTVAGTTSSSFASIAGSGTTTITGTLGTAAQSGETITIAYDEATGDLVDDNTNVVADIAATAVTNNAVAPVLLTATIEDGAQTALVMVFDQSITGTNLGFTVGGTTSTSFASIAGSGTATITGTMAAKAVFGETVTLTYSETTGDLADGDTNPVVDIVATAVTNNAAAPILNSVTIADGAQTDIVMVFDQNITGTNLGFTVAGTTSSTFASISGSGTTTITGVLGTTALAGETITITYVKATGDLADADGNDVQDLTNQAVTNNAVPPTISTSTVEDLAPTDIVIVFNEVVTGTNLGFTIAGTASTGFESISGSGTNTITGVLAIGVANGDVVLLSYSDSAGDIIDGDTNHLADVTDQAVTNNVT